MTTPRVIATITDPTHAVLTQDGHEDTPLEVTDTRALRPRLIAELAQRATTARTPLAVTVLDQATGRREDLTVDPTRGVTTTPTHPGAPTPPTGTPAATRPAITTIPRAATSTTSTTKTTKTPTAGPTGLVDRLVDAPTTTKILLTTAAVVVLALLVSLLALLTPKDQTTTQATDTPQGATDTNALPDGCLAGTDVAQAARTAGQLATTSTITQDGITVSSPEGAATAAAAYARLKTTLPAPTDRDGALASILAPDASASARTLIPDAAGWKTHLDMTRARWALVSGDGRTAGIDLLLYSVGSKDDAPAQSSQYAVHMDLVNAGGKWLLKDTSTPKNVAQLATANPFHNSKACS